MTSTLGVCGREASLAGSGLDTFDALWGERGERGYYLLPPGTYQERQMSCITT